MAKTYKKITYADRKKIEILLSDGYRPKTIADEVGVCCATIYRELDRGRDESGQYNADISQRKIFN